MGTNHFKATTVVSPNISGKVCTIEKRHTEYKLELEGCSFSTRIKTFYICSLNLVYLDVHISILETSKARNVHIVVGITVELEGVKCICTFCRSNAQFSSHRSSKLRFHSSLIRSVLSKQVGHGICPLISIVVIRSAVIFKGSVEPINIAFFSETSTARSVEVGSIGSVVRRDSTTEKICLMQVTSLCKQFKSDDMSISYPPTSFSKRIALNGIGIVSTSHIHISNLVYVTNTRIMAVLVIKRIIRNQSWI